MDGASIAGWDKFNGYLLLATSCDGSSATDLRGVVERVVCANTPAMAMSEKGNKRASVRHSTVFNADALKRKMGLSLESFAHFAEVANRLAQAKVSAAASEKFLDTLLRPSKATIEHIAAEKEVAAALARMTGKKEEERKPAGYDQILALFNGQGLGSTLPGSKGTAWGLLNACTEHYSWHRFAKSDDHRFESSLFGSGDEIKTKAFRLAQEMFL